MNFDQYVGWSHPILKTKSVKLSCSMLSLRACSSNTVILHHYTPIQSFHSFNEANILCLLTILQRATSYVCLLKHCFGLPLLGDVLGSNQLQPLSTNNSKILVMKIYTDGMDIYSYKGRSIYWCWSCSVCFKSAFVHSLTSVSKEIECGCFQSERLEQSQQLVGKRHNYIIMYVYSRVMIQLDLQTLASSW